MFGRAMRDMYQTAAIAHSGELRYSPVGVQEIQLHGRPVRLADIMQGPAARDKAVHTKARRWCNQNSFS